MLAEAEVLIMSRSFFGFDKVSYHDENLALAETVYNNVRLAIVRRFAEFKKEKAKFQQQAQGRKNHS